MRRGMTAAALVCAVAMVLAALAGCGGTAPTVDTITPPSAAGGTLVAVGGSAFGKTQSSGKVMFGSTVAEAQSWTDTAIAVRVPSALKAGKVQVTVVAGGNTSNGVLFTILAGSSSEAQKQGEIEHNTPVQAMTAYLKAHGEPTTGYTFMVDSISKTDPNWKIDASFYTGNPQAGYWLLHNVNGTWKVLAYGTDWDPQKLGAPADLKIVAVAPPSPTPPAKPSTEAEAIQSFLASQGKPVDNWQLSLLKASTVDPNWEVIHGVRNGATDNFLMVWNNMLGNWQVIADGGPPWTGDQFKGEAVPKDIAQ